jgi:hypothetical protein
MAINEIKENDSILARHISAQDAWGGGLNFFSKDSEFQQVGTWVYQSGKELHAHSHNEIERKVQWTQEVLYVKKGKIRADIYSTKNKKITEIFVGEGDILILLMGGHGYEILADNTQVLEIKNGPYLGAETDRKRFRSEL